jgi:hypothetical protein
MVFILHRYIFRELIKVFVLATVALTLIMSLGSILRPIQEYGVGPAQVVHLMGYFLPITLTFVLPMSALFAAALVYGRFACDNELDACRASGISLLTLVYPGLTLAIIVAIVNLILSFHVVPAFVHRAEKSLKANAKQILFRNIQRRGFYKLPPDERFRIYADEANMRNGTLYGVVVTEVKKNKIDAIITAENAKISFVNHERFNEVQVAANHVYQMGSDNSGWFYVARLPVKHEFPSLLGDNIKFKKIDEMKKIRVDPIRFYPIEAITRQAYAQLTAELLAEDISRQMLRDSNDFYELIGEPNSIKFTATNCLATDEKEIELSGEVVVLEFDTDTKQPLRTLRCVRALLNIEGDELAPTLNERLVSLQKQLRRKINKTLVEIKAEINTRLVFGIGCVPLIMIGIGLGIILKGGHLLSAFGASSIPGGLLIICIMMGKNLAKNPGSSVSSGILIIWAGLVLLTLLAAGIYHRLLKN